jgi:hypothetical protein
VLQVEAARLARLGHLSVEQLEALELVVHDRHKLTLGRPRAGGLDELFYGHAHVDLERNAARCVAVQVAVLETAVWRVRGPLR